MRNACCINMADAPRDHAAEGRSNAVAKEPAQLPNVVSGIKIPAQTTYRSGCSRRL